MTKISIDKTHQQERGGAVETQYVATLFSLSLAQTGLNLPRKRRFGKQGRDNRMVQYMCNLWNIREVYRASQPVCSLTIATLMGYRLSGSSLRSYNEAHLMKLWSSKQGRLMGLEWMWVFGRMGELEDERVQYRLGNKHPLRGSVTHHSCVLGA
uniref:Uncharacterized protein n=1 Tax=Timema genevievae TaxID=629358 RepID=A0A7R9PJL1_TIMGE|nr:unnamed protein product [Timema genevievae]